MSNTNTGGPAFPAQFFDERSTGMTLRDYLAAKAMQGELASQREGYEWRSPEKLARHSYNIADAMLEARSE